MALPINCIPSSCGEKLTRNFVVGCLFLYHSSARRAIFLGGKKIESKESQSPNTISLLASLPPYCSFPGYEMISLERILC